MKEALFSKYQWYGVQKHITEQIKQEIESYNPNQLLNTSIDNLLNYFIQKYKIDIPKIVNDDIYVEQNETQVDVSHDPHRFIIDRNRPAYVPGVEVIFTLPFEGDQDFFYVQPTTFDYDPPYAAVNNGCLKISFKGAELTEQRIKESFQAQKESIEKYLTRLRSDAQTFNTNLSAFISNNIETRKKRLLTNQNLVANLGFPLKQRADSQLTYVTDKVRRKIIPQKPVASTDPYKPEPILQNDDYEHILTILNNMVLTMERSPTAFATLNEEDLRNHFLMQLNGHYEGKATGETFNFSGKTDILIRDNGKNIFIGECKFWGGQKKLLETIDQILSYSSWRDTKTAILIFNKNKNFTEVLNNIPPTVEQHPNFLKRLANKSETEFRYKFSNKDDTNRELFLSILVYNIPQKDVTK